MSHAGVEEMPGRCGLGRRFHHRPGRSCLDRQRSEQLRVDLGAVEVGHLNPGGELGQLAGHPDGDDLAHLDVRRPAQGDPGEVANLDEEHRSEPRREPVEQGQTMPEVPRMKLPLSVPRGPLVVSAATASPPGTEKVTSTGPVPASARAATIMRLGTESIAGSPTARPGPGLVMVPIPSPAWKACARWFPRHVPRQSCGRRRCSQGRHRRLSRQRPGHRSPIRRVSPPAAPRGSATSIRSGRWPVTARGRRPWQTPTRKSRWSIRSANPSGRRLSG